MWVWGRDILSTVAGHISVFDEKQIVESGWNATYLKSTTRTF